MVNTTSGKSHPWVETHLLFLTVILLGLLGFLISRICLLYAYGDVQSTTLDWPALSNDLWYGTRLDLKLISTFLLLPYLLFILISGFLPGQLSRFNTLIACLSFPLLLVSTVFMVVNYYYFGVFNNHIDVFIFDFVEPGNTIEVLKTIWIDFPVLLNLLFFLIAGIAIWKALRHFPALIGVMLGYPRHRVTRVAVVLLSLVMLLGAARGAITARPLSVTRATLSTDRFYNKLVPNGIVAFYEATKRNKRKMNIASISEAQLQSSFKQYFPAKITTGKVQLDDYLGQTTLKEPRKAPNVVLSLMESFGARLLSFHSSTNNVYGSLESHANEDFLFTKFTSATINTIGSLEKLLAVHDFSASVSTSRYKRVTYLASAAKLFREKGYRTVFITNGRKSWANLDEFLQMQGFDEVHDEYTILNAVPGSRGGRAWGVYDEYGYDYILSLLKEDHEKPLFVVLLTITNHSPFEPPMDYVGYPVDISAVLPHTSLTDHDKIRSIIKTYQYANDALGNFITGIKSDPQMRSSTVIAATGDHELRYLFRDTEEKISWRYRVPFYLYLPSEYALGTTRDLNRFGSHRDIFPTIYNRIFANTPYYETGQDLLASNYSDEMAFSRNREFVMNYHGAIHKSNSVRTFYEWQSEEMEDLVKVSDPGRGLLSLEARSNAYDHILAAFTRMQIDTPPIQRHK